VPLKLAVCETQADAKMEPLLEELKLLVHNLV
jgi:hypothetical protein